MKPSPAIPHGIRYNLTVHDPNNKRLLGFDNAHGVKPKKGEGSGKYRGQIVAYEHVHCGQNDKGTPYRCKDAQTLVSDFYSEMTKREP